MPIIEVNGARVYVEGTGPPLAARDAAAVVFGHGVLFSGRSFAGQVARLRDRYRCVTIDWRGQGRTPATESGYDMDTLTEDTIGVVEALGLAPVHFVGLSMGGFVGMRLGARHPELLRSLTLIETSAGPEDRRERPHATGCWRWSTASWACDPVKSQVLPVLFGPTYLADPSGPRPRSTRGSASSRRPRPLRHQEGDLRRDRPRPDPPGDQPDRRTDSCDRRRRRRRRAGRQAETIAGRHLQGHAGDWCRTPVTPARSSNPGPWPT